MPTPKQVRYHFRRISRLHDELAEALSKARYANVLVYKDYANESPCKTHYQTWERILATTEKRLAEAMRTEINNEGKG